MTNFPRSRCYYECVAVVAERLGPGNPDAVRKAAAEEMRARWREATAEQRARTIEAERELSERKDQHRGG